MGLLKWLATCHAAEDINSDDELVRETILSPLLPSTTIDKVLEKASIDYESESQKECQDILDSIGDLIEFEDQKERTSHSFDYAKVSSGKIIPQTDGSSDDPSLSPSGGSVGNSSKTNIKTEFRRSSQDTGKTFSSKRKSKQSLWGSLPLSVAEKGKDNSDSISFNLTKACADETKEYLGTSFSAENDWGKTSGPLSRNIHANDCDKQEANTLIECSTRDLMRRKRSRRIEPAGCGYIRGENVHFKVEKETPILFCPKKLDFHGLYDELEKKAPGSLNHRPPLVNEQKEFHEAVGFKSTHSDLMYCTLPQLSGIYNPPQSNTSHPEQMGNNLALNFFPEKHDSAISVGNCETCSGKEFEPRATFAEPINFDAYSSKSRKEIDFPVERLNQTVTGSSWCLTASPCEDKMLGIDGYIQGNNNMAGTSLSTDKLVVVETMTNKSDLLSEDCGGRKHNCNSRLVVDKEAKPMELIGMTCEKPQTADGNDVATKNVSHSPTTQFCPLFNEGNYQVTSGEFCISLILCDFTFCYFYLWLKPLLLKHKQ